MKFHMPEVSKARLIFVFISVFSILSTAGTVVLASETLYLPVIASRGPAPTATATLSATVTATPTEGPDTIQLMVTPEEDKDWAVAWFAYSYNKAGRPVMQIYPGDSKPASERIKFPRGQVVEALPEQVRADGGGKFWQLVDYKGEIKGKEVALFLRALDVTKVTLSEAGEWVIVEESEPLATETPAP